jgi:hypothetical protein
MLSFPATGTTLSFNVLESGYTGLLTATSGGATACAGIATFTASGTGPAVTINVTSVAAGQCQVVVHDTNGQSASVTVIVTATTGVVF